MKKLNLNDEIGQIMVVDFFYNAKRYHLDCKLWERNSVYIHYYTSKNENNLVSFTLLKKIENLDVIQHFDFLINIQKIRKMKLCMKYVAIVLMI